MNNFYASNNDLRSFFNSNSPLNLAFVPPGGGMNNGMWNTLFSSYMNPFDDQQINYTPRCNNRSQINFGQVARSNGDNQQVSKQEFLTAAKAVLEQSGRTMSDETLNAIFDEKAGQDGIMQRQEWKDVFGASSITNSTFANKLLELGEVTAPYSFDNISTKLRDDGVINYAEFSKAAREANPALTNQEIKTAFLGISNGKNVISASDFADAFPEPLTKESFKSSVLAQANDPLNKSFIALGGADGKLTFNEVMTALNASSSGPELTKSQFTAFLKKWGLTDSQAETAYSNVLQNDNGNVDKKTIVNLLKDNSTRDRYGYRTISLDQFKDIAAAIQSESTSYQRRPTDRSPQAWVNVDYNLYPGYQFAF